MTDTAKGYLRYGAFVVFAVVVFAVSVWGGYRFTLGQRQKNATSDGANEPLSQPVQKTLETVSEDTQVVNVESLPGIYFHCLQQPAPAGIAAGAAETENTCQAA